MTNRTFGTLLALSIVLSGCTSDEKKPTVLPPAPSASPSAAAPPPLPPEALAETPQGAAAFTRFFFAEVNRAYEIQDPRLIDALSASQCQSCKNAVEDVTRLQRAEHKVSGLRFKIEFAETRPTDSEGRVIVDFRFSSDPYLEQDRTGKLIREEPAQIDQNGQARLVWEAGRWLLSGIRLVEQ